MIPPKPQSQNAPGTSQAPLDFEGLALIAGGHSAFQLFWAAVELGVFAVLSRNPGLNRAQLGSALSLEPQPTRILMTGLTALRLVIKDGDTFQNAAIVDQLFVPGKPESMVEVLGWQHHIVYPAMVDFCESLQRNTNVGLRHFRGSERHLYGRLAHEPKLEFIFQNAMSALSRANNPLLLEHWDVSRMKHVVDAGGGDATNAIALAKANPHLRVTVFDAPSVCEIANKKIAEAELHGRVTTHAGDLFVDAFPSDADCILFCHLLTIWSRAKNVSLLRRAHQALAPNGTVAIFNMMAWDNDEGPMTAALGSPYFLAIATGEGMLYAWAEYEQMLNEAGFQKTQRTPLLRDHGLLVGTKMTAT